MSSTRTRSHDALEAALVQFDYNGGNLTGNEIVAEFRNSHTFPQETSGCLPYAGIR